MVQSCSICLPMQETHIWSLDWVDTLGEEMATHSSILMGNFMDRRVW